MDKFNLNINTKNKTKNNSKHRKVKKDRSGFVTAILSIFLIGVLTVAIVGASLVIYIVSFANGELAIDLDNYKNNQNQSTMVYAYDDSNEPKLIQTLHGSENRVWVDLADMGPYLYDTVIALEDKRFEKHNGVDWKRTFSAVLTTGKSGGGSTITQQLIKNLTGEKDLTVVRKFNEILYALNLEKSYEKSEILEAYLNTIYLGEGCYGVKTAAEKYFDKDVSELNLTECACLVSITNAPGKYDPLVNPETNRERVDYCLKQMLEQGKINKSEYNEAMEYQLVFKDGSLKAKENESKTVEIQSYYIDYVIDSVVEDLKEKYNYTTAQAENKIYYGGLKIYSAVDLNVQNAMEDEYYNRRSFSQKEGDAKEIAQSAMVIMNYEGRVCGIMGGAGTKPGNRCLNRATKSTRSPGSAIKPLSIYAPAIELGIINYSSMILDAQIYVDGNLWPQNYGGGTGSGTTVSAQKALARSLNTVPARILTDLTFARSFNYLKKNFHISTLAETGSDTDINYSPLAVGGMVNGVKLIDITAAYAAFGNGGMYYKPYCYYKVENADGEVILQTESKGERAISAETANIMNQMLQTVVTDSQGTVQGYGVSGQPTFAKSGTTSNDYDRWFMGGTPYYVSGTWYGYDEQKRITGTYGNPAGNIFRSIMKVIHKDKATGAFPTSDNVVKLAYCADSGLLATDACPNIKYGYYNKNSLPEACSTHGGTPVETTTAETTEQQFDVVVATTKKATDE
ncbi:MAG: penicillin-binding protein [Clostridiales bacterium]|nr:penicillin-binding protein [Clostridiales bacterium]